MIGTLLKLIDVPPVWLVLAMAVTWIVGKVLPMTVVDNVVLNAAGYTLIAAAVLLMVWCGYLFHRQKTSIRPRNVPVAMITDGPYRFSRNPIYLADALILFGYILVIGSPIALITLPAFVLIINRRFIAGEEAVLRQEFGEEFATWSTRVRRWI